MLSIKVSLFIWEPQLHLQLLHEWVNTKDNQIWCVSVNQCLSFTCLFIGLLSVPMFDMAPQRQSREERLNYIYLTIDLRLNIENHKIMILLNFSFPQAWFLRHLWEVQLCAGGPFGWDRLRELHQDSNHIERGVWHKACRQVIFAYFIGFGFCK